MVAKIIMIQGVSSNAGKSIITGALCRYFRNQGKRVAPFKPILVCNDGVEENGLITDKRFLFSIRAAKLSLSLDNNPVQIVPIKQDWLSQIMSPATLRFPNNDTCTIPLLGRDTPLFERMPIAIQERIKAVIQERLQRLCESYDLIIVEGAGNPTDLGVYDLTNFYIATEFALQTILVTKISAGGAAASLVGTFLLLQEEIKKTVTGFILNDLIDGDEVATRISVQLADRLKIPCLGIFPNLWSVAPWQSPEQEIEDLAKLVEQNINMGFINSLRA